MIRSLIRSLIRLSFFPFQSLTLRLLLGAGLWIAVALAISGLALQALFRQHVEESLIVGLTDDMENLLASLDIGPGFSLTLRHRLGNPRFVKPYSGRYWQVEPVSGPPLRSRSLWDATLTVPADPLLDGALHRHVIHGPNGQHLLVLERGVRLPEQPAPIRLLVAADGEAVHSAVSQFRTVLSLALLVLGLGLLLAVALQVGLGLAPLRRLRRALAAVRRGEQRRLAGSWPAEVAPLVHDLNGTLDHVDATLTRARAQAGNLAHALKTPLAVLAAAGDDAPEAPLAPLVRKQVAIMRRQVDHHLARARAAATATVPGARCDVGRVAERLISALRILHRDRPTPVTLIQDAPAAVFFHGDSEDLTEMLGNLLDNAARWAKTTVRLTLHPAPLSAAGAPTGSAPLSRPPSRPPSRQIRIQVDDDGPGLTPEQRQTLPVRGARLDESTPGTGLGLSIVAELAELYGGGLELAASPLGGLQVNLHLPASGDDAP